MNSAGWAIEWKWCQRLTCCCSNDNLFERSLKHFLFINLGEVKEKRFQLVESEGGFWNRLERILLCIFF
jgi:hypothetical protein